MKKIIFGKCYAFACAADLEDLLAESLSLYPDAGDRTPVVNIRIGHAMTARRPGSINPRVHAAFERGMLTIELPAPFAEEEAQVILDHGGERRRLERANSWAFRRQAGAFVSDVAERRIPLASGEDSVVDIALAEAVWKRAIG